MRTADIPFYCIITVIEFFLAVVIIAINEHNTGISDLHILYEMPITGTFCIVVCNEFYEKYRTKDTGRKF